MTAPRTEIRVAPADFDVGVELAALYERTGGQLGAVASFVGLVRDRFEDSAVTALHLEHYPGMTEKSIAAIVDQAAARWPLMDVLVVHRVGELTAREQIVFVQVGSGHRDAAFAAAEFIMDYLKTDAVFWKREVQPDADRWVESTVEDQARRRSWDEPAGRGSR
jgi:molybdopterin synthase catalytic subunit